MNAADDEVQRWVCDTCGHSFWVVCSNPDCPQPADTEPGDA